MYRSRYMLLIVFVFMFICYAYDGFTSKPSTTTFSILNDFSPSGFREVSFSHSVLLTLNTMLLITCLISYCIMELFHEHRDVQHLFFCVIFSMYTIFFTLLDWVRSNELRLGLCFRVIDCLIIYICTSLKVQTIVILVIVTIVVQVANNIIRQLSVTQIFLETSIFLLFHFGGGLLYFQTYLRSIEALYAENYSVELLFRFLDFQYLHQKDLFLPQKTETQQNFNSVEFQALSFCKPVLFSDIKRTFGSFKLILCCWISKRLQCLKQLLKRCTVVKCSGQRSGGYFSNFTFSCSPSLNQKSLDDDTFTRYVKQVNRGRCSVPRESSSKAAFMDNCNESKVWSLFSILRCTRAEPRLHISKDDSDFLMNDSTSESCSTCNEGSPKCTVFRWIDQGTHYWKSSYEFFVKRFYALTLPKPLLQYGTHQLTRDTLDASSRDFLALFHKNFIAKEFHGYRSIGLLGTPSTNRLWEYMMTSALYKKHALMTRNSIIQYGLRGHLPFQRLAEWEPRMSLSLTRHSSIEDLNELTHSGRRSGSSSGECSTERNGSMTMARDSFRCSSSEIEFPMESDSSSTASIKIHLKRGLQSKGLNASKQSPLAFALHEMRSIEQDMRVTKDMSKKSDSFIHVSSTQHSFYKTKKKRKTQQKQFSNTANEPLMKSALNETSLEFRQTRSRKDQEAQAFSRFELLESLCMIPFDRKQAIHDTWLAKHHSRCADCHRAFPNDSQSSYKKVAVEPNAGNASRALQHDRYHSRWKQSHTELVLQSYDRTCRKVSKTPTFSSFDDLESLSSQDWISELDLLHAAMEKSNTVYTRLCETIRVHLQACWDKIMDIIWIIMEFLGLTQVIHFLICCNFVLNLTSWNGKPRMLKRGLLSFAFQNPYYEELYWDWTHLMDVESRHMRAAVQLLGTLLNLGLLGVSMLLLSSNFPIQSRTTLTIFADLFIQNTSHVQSKRLSEFKRLFSSLLNRSVLCLVFSTLEIILISSQLVIWEVYCRSALSLIACLLDLERFAMSLLCLIIHTKCLNSDIEVYGLLILNMILSPLNYPYCSAKFNFYFIFKTFVINGTYVSCVSRVCSFQCWRWQCFRMNIVLFHCWIITFFLHLRASEECRRRLFCLVCFPYLLELSRLVEKSDNWGQERDLISSTHLSKPSPCSIQIDSSSSPSLSSSSYMFSTNKAHHSWNSKNFSLSGLGHHGQVSYLHVDTSHVII